MNESQRNRIAPYWDAIKLFHDEGQWIGGQDGLNIMNDVNKEMGNMPTSFNCNACVRELLKLTYNNYTNGTGKV